MPIHDFNHEIGENVFINHGDGKCVVTVVGYYYDDTDKWYLCETVQKNKEKLDAIDLQISSAKDKIIFLAEPDELEPVYRELNLAVSNT